LKPLYFLLFLLSTCFFFAQKSSNSSTFHFNPEVLVGISSESNTDFPDRDLQTQVFLNFGWFHSPEKHPWLNYLKTEKSGLSLGYTSLGNSEFLGEIITLQPYFEFGAFNSERFHLHVGTGLSYFTEQYDPVTNPTNRAVSTDFTWAFKLFLYYDLYKMKALNWRLGAGYVHNSNGHTSLPNQGINSFLLSLGLQVDAPPNDLNTYEKKKFTSNYYSLRMGYGINALTESINQTKAVYTLSGEYGKVYNGIFKLGFGGYARFYEMYYDYISDNESLVQDGREYDYLKDDPFLNAINFGISGNAELILNHIGIDVQIGINFYKPAYELDWTLNQGWGFVPREIPEEGGNFRLGDTDEAYFYIKKYISARMGLKYYVWNTKHFRSHNVYVGAFINSNLGQADFTEFAIGYVKQFNLQHK
jgi:hypothetical protein